MTTDKTSKPTRITPGEYVHFGYTISRYSDPNRPSSRWYYIRTEDGKLVGTERTLRDAAAVAVSHLEGR